MSKPMTKRRLPVWRSLFCVPVTNDRFIESAHTRGADAIILDLEDGVAWSRKEEARQKVQAAAEKVSRGGVDILARINRPWRMAMRDVEAVVGPRIGGLVLPKVADASHVRVLSEMVGELEKERNMEEGVTKFFVLVETADAYPRMEEIAQVDPRVIAMCLGVEDFSASCGMLPEADGLYVPKMQMLIMARAAGILPIGTLHSIADYKDLEGWRNAALRARRLGYRGAVCIHPGQIPILNEAFSPTEQEIVSARRIVEAAIVAEKSGVGACEVDGKMIDWPVVERAREIIDIHEAILKVGSRARQ